MNFRRSLNSANRRSFLSLGAAAFSAWGYPQGDITIRAIAFDAFVIFDPRPVFSLVERLFPEKGRDLVNTWRTRQFEYTWLRSVSNQYVDFWHVTEDALTFAAKSLAVDLSAESRRKIMNAYLELRSWPEVPQGLRLLKE